MPSLSAALFRPFKIGSLELKNRIVMAPMTRNMASNGVPGDLNAAYYRRRAEGGVGLIISEGTVVDRPASRNDPNIPFFYGDAALSGWKSVIDEVQAAGGRMAPQIWHAGALEGLTGWEPDAHVESPSALIAPNVPRGDVMNEEAIADTVAAFASAAADAKRLGFDTVEVHGAHGYLIDQFLWAGTNTRTDRFGGATIRERSRFAADVVAAVRAAVGPHFPIILRLSQWKMQDYTARLAQNPSEMADWLQPLVDAGANVLHCSQRRYWEPEFPEIDGAGGLNFAGWAKKLTGAATISVGSVGLSNDTSSAFAGEGANSVGLEQLIDRMEREEFDLIAVGRALLADPEWVAKIRGDNTDSLKGFHPSAFAELK
ncbi:NADH:flavin oxidoreductase [Paraburkholderia dipogonis]|uniref:NADH:flavin oxidoreductase n=1 Tax=Paraburkholderia dipogonis TaxID=1211383 RepID=A0A4Y8MWK5_9BURK|nr:NADH:flavin oxidoreductase [Paraburkholderia dipogonis]TFE41926.1 NADH:flavin oxidoreductase [Paraburkholderia dipogonis]